MVTVHSLGGGKYWAHPYTEDCGVPFEHVHYGENVVLRPTRNQVPLAVLYALREFYVVFGRPGRERPTGIIDA